jgi:hypothetical protein
MNSFFTVFDDTRASTLISNTQVANTKNSIFVRGFSLGAFNNKDKDFRIIVDNNTLRLFHLLRFLGLPSVCPSSSTEESCYKADVEADIANRLKSVHSIPDGLPISIALAILNQMFGDVILLSSEVTWRILNGDYEPNGVESPGLKALCEYMKNPKSVAPIASITSITTKQQGYLNTFDKTYMQT